MTPRDRLEKLLIDGYEWPPTEIEEWFIKYGSNVLALIIQAEAETISHSFALPELEKYLAPLIIDEEK
jgi:hypothetical protein